MTELARTTTRRFSLALGLSALALGMFALLCDTGMVRASEMKSEIDTTAETKLLGSHFAGFGYAPTRTVMNEGASFRIRLPSGLKNVEQTGMYGYFALSGDFEVSATFDLISAMAPQGGYGVSCGIAVDCQKGGVKVALTRGLLPKKGLGYFIVSRGEKPYDAADWKTTDYVSQSKKGRLVLRREKGEIICLAADGLRDEPKELCRLPYSTETVSRVRFYADTGESPTSIDARIGEIKVRAEEITGAIPKKDIVGGYGGWLTASGILLLGVLGYVLYRRKRQGAEEEEQPARPTVKKKPSVAIQRPKYTPK